MNRMRRVSATLAAFAAALLGLSAAAPAAFASTNVFPAPGGGGRQRGPRLPPPATPSSWAAWQAGRSP
jgi:hypothetical protein